MPTRWREGSVWTQTSGLNLYEKEILADKPVAYWRLREAAGTTVEDITGNGHDGSLVNSPLLNVDGAMSGTGSGIHFDDAIDRFDVGTLDSLGSSIGSGVTMEYWIRWAHTNTSQAVGGVLNSNSSTGLYTAINWNENANSDAGNIFLFVRDDGSNTIWASPTTNPGLNDDVWHHVVWVVEDPVNNIARCYVDGSEVSLSYGQSESPSSFSDIDLSWPWGARNSGNGISMESICYLDEPAVYDSVLSAQRVQDHYYSSFGLYAKAVLDDRPVAYWRLGEASGASTARDRTVNGHDGTYVNGPTLGTTGVLDTDDDTAVSFDGTDDYVDFGTPSALDITGDLTIEAWVKAPSSTSAKTIVTWANENHTDFAFHAMIKADSDGGTLRLNRGSNFDSVSRVDDGEWHHVVITDDRVNDQASWYIDGVLDIQGSYTPNVISSNDKLTISRDYTNFFQDVMDEVAIYDKVLTEAQIQAHYDAAKV